MKDIRSSISFFIKKLHLYYIFVKRLFNCSILCYKYIIYMIKRGKIKMEQTTQFNYNSNEIKPKKKGKIVVGIILTIILIAVIALVAVYFLVFSKPENIFL